MDRFWNEIIDGLKITGSNKTINTQNNLLHLLKTEPNAKIMNTISLAIDLALTSMD